MRVPGVGVRVGIDPVLGVLPVAGVLVSAVFSLYIVAESAYLGVSFTTVVEMLVNITIDIVGGSVLYAGTVVDALWKGNKRNVTLALEELAEAVETDGPGGGTDSGVDIPVESENREEPLR